MSESALTPIALSEVGKVCLLNCEQIHDAHHNHALPTPGDLSPAPCPLCVSHLLVPAERLQDSGRSGA